MDINELSGWGISQQIAQIVENSFTFDEETLSTNCVELISQSDNQCVIKGLIKNEWIVLLCKDKETDETLCMTSIFIK